jgi:hypothetical protein
MPDTVNVACGLPNGLTLEVGAAKVLKSGELSPTYKSVHLVGFVEAGKKAVTYPTKGKQRFAVTSVPADVWAAWLAKNKTLRYVVEGSVFAVP